MNEKIGDQLTPQNVYISDERSKVIIYLMTVVILSHDLLCSASALNHQEKNRNRGGEVEKKPHQNCERVKQEETTTNQIQAPLVRWKCIICKIIKYFKINGCQYNHIFYCTYIKYL